MKRGPKKVYVVVGIDGRGTTFTADLKEAERAWQNRRDYAFDMDCHIETYVRVDPKRRRK